MCVAGRTDAEVLARAQLRSQPPPLLEAFPLRAGGRFDDAMTCFWKMLRALVGMPESSKFVAGEVRGYRSAYGSRT